MEVIRYKYVFLSLVLMLTNVYNKTTKQTIQNSTCPFSKIIKDIFKVNKNSVTNANTNERAKLFLHSIANITNQNNNITEEELINDIIAAINRIKNNMTQESPSEQKLNEAILLVPNEESKINKVTGIKSGMEDKNDITFSKPNLNKPNFSETVTEKTNYVEILTIEPNNTQKTNVTSHNIIDVLKNLMPTFNHTKENLHNITIIESNIHRNHSISTSKNVSTIIVTYCDKNNSSFTNLTETKDNNNDVEYDYYNESPDAEEEEDDGEDITVTDGEKKDILEATKYGMEKMHELYSVLEPKLYSMGLWLDDTNPARYVAAFNAPSEDATKYTRYGYASLQAATKLKELSSMALLPAMYPNSLVEINMTVGKEQHEKQL